MKLSTGAVLFQPAFACSRSAIETRKEYAKERSDVVLVSIVNFAHISHKALLFPLLL